MHAFICTICGTHFTPSATPPAHCPICENERQYIGPNGQQWTTLLQPHTGAPAACPDPA